MNWMLDRLYVMTSILDATLIAGSGFLVNLLAGRFLSTEHYGVFITLYTLASLSLIFQAALVSNPYTVLSQSVEKDNQASYFTGTLLITVGLGALLGLASAAGSMLYLQKVEQSLFLCCLFVLYIFFNLIQDFIRRYFYSVQQESQAFILDLISYGGQVLAIAWKGHSLKLPQLFILLISTTVVSLIISALLNRHRIFPMLKSQRLSITMSNALRKNWEFGRWILFSNSVSWIASQIYILALGLWHPSVVVAQLSAARTLAAASNPLIMAYEAIGLPRMTCLLGTGGLLTVQHYVFRIAVLGCIFFLLLGGLFFIFPLQTIQLIYGKSFGDISLLVRIFSFLPAMWFVGKVFSIAILSMKRSKILFPIYLLACMSTLTIGLWMTFQFGALGAGLGFLLNGIILSVGFGIQFFGEIKTWQHESLLEAKT